MATAREIVYELLLKTEIKGAYSNIALDNALSGNNFKPKDKAFATALFYGVLERRMTLDYLIRAYSSVEYDNIDKGTVQLLRMGLYQLLYMDSVPDSAAVNETVTLCHPKAKGFVNAILRSFLRDGKKIDYKDLDEIGTLSIKYSCPKWLVKMWTADYGRERTESMLSASFGRPPLFVKVNTLKCTADELIAELAADKIKARRNARLIDCVEIDRVNSIETCRAYRKGMFHVQDISSQLCCRIVKPQVNDVVLDMCAAPGGKTFSLAEAMGNKGEVHSFDLYGGRVSLIGEGARRLGIDIIKPQVNDAAVLNPRIPQADKVLCDVVCSGLGVIRRKPEIKYKNKADLEGLPEIQARILETASNYVKAGGVLVYSTCTLNKAENEDVVNGFLSVHKEFVPIVVHIDSNDTEAGFCRSFLPDMTGGDGFFVATMKRVK